MTDALVKILQDEKLQAKYSAKSLEIAQKHDLGHTLRRFVEIYEEAIELKGKKVNLRGI